MRFSTSDEVKSQGWVCIKSGAGIMLAAIGTAAGAIFFSQNEEEYNSVDVQAMVSMSGITGALSMGLISYGMRMICNPDIYITPPEVLEDVEVVPVAAIVNTRIAG